MVVLPTALGVGLTLLPTGAAPLAVGVAIALDLAVLGAIWLALRPGAADVGSAEELARAVRGGRPMVVELYSNFCLICMANRHTIKVAATTVGAGARFIRVELPSDAGAAIGEAYGVRYTPSYLVFDEHGDLVRTILPDNVTPLANGYRVTDGSGALVSRLQRVSPEDLVAMVREAV